MFLTKEAVRIAGPGFWHAIACDGCPTLDDLMGRFEQAGGRFLMYPICFDAHKIDKGNLLSNAEPGRTFAMWNWIGDDGATTFSY
ncbi:peroxiredoxin [Arthrobacter sp. ISL-72]|uniref:peroxiredoxin n=1 Tax=Arthrobacter sp. ISL-72 TaxID=2819114 RepID=UPI002034C7FF|nr:peroxiredoxin [Arthrobacter sp. ISL-72]